MSDADPRSGCRGLTPLSGRLERWQVAMCRRPDRLGDLLEAHDSPINLINPALMERNAAELRGAAAAHQVNLKISFARKANKAIALIDEARRIGLGIDLASERELEQALARGVDAENLVMTAAVKPLSLLAACVKAGVVVVIDNEDELKRISTLTQGEGRIATVILRLAPATIKGAPPSRFGLGLQDARELVERNWLPGADVPLRITGVHFHLNGYDPDARVAAVRESLELVDWLRARGHHVKSIDIGGGIPMSYLDSEDQWSAFWSELRRALSGGRPELTYEGHGLGLVSVGGQIVGAPNVYPFRQALTRGEWFGQILSATADEINSRGLQLHCQPGRALLDGSGMTVARVEFRKQRVDGTWLIGLGMNRTQCRSTSDDFLVDPLLIETDHGSHRPVDRSTGPIEAYLVGAYCIERELLTWRKLQFPRGVGVGDYVAFPNTAGYMMHILESSSHQIPLAKNLITNGETAQLDLIYQ